MTSLRTLQNPVDDMSELSEGHSPQSLAHIGLPNDTEKAILKVVRIPFQNLDYPGQWFYGLRFSLAILTSQKSHLNELITIVRQQVSVIAAPLQQQAVHDFSKTHM